MKTLIVSVDRSKEKRTIYALVVIKYENLGELRRKSGWLRHISELKKQEKRNYVSKFPQRFASIKSLLDYVEVTPYFDDLYEQMAKFERDARVLIIDDVVLSKKLREYQSRKNVFRESIAKKRWEFRHIVLLTDNIAYISREIYEQTPNLRALKKALRRKGIL
ncbi:hypothetical protein [Thermococcus thioreducens]|uniref:Uncharacterized protein n=1 Tax=Thermococcus thioreducens TaxID=277988 RepID=A0A0Q2M351_9EURY|nr:hypothetical protein [Thermococcus thioreducens]ASJ12882.1 hypothetical protein A3L14_08280 [Thermococcus thioreducens]KQH82346.1 hypothetical protein AMR53_07040 [Thermococcus thioreducens]SEV83894.1 hypothetical protein SAMN05216170_0289 [Thermococcus thioreducens]